MARTLDELNADIRDLTAQLGKARKALRGYEASADKAADATGRAGVKVRGASLDIKEGKERLEGFGASLRAVGGDIGPLEDMATALEKLGPAGFAAAAGVAALVAGAFAVAKFAEVTIEATRAAGELLEEWDHPEVFADQADAIADANAALDDLVFAGQRLQVLFAAGMSPAVVDTVDTVLTLVLAAQDAVGVLSDWSGTIARVAGGLLDLTASAFPPLMIVLAEFRALADGVGLALDYLGDKYEEDVEALKTQADAVRRVADEYDDFSGVLLDAAEAEADFVRVTDRERQRLYREEQRRRERRAREEQKAREAALEAERQLIEQLNAERDAALAANLDRIAEEVKAGKGSNEDLAADRERIRLADLDAAEAAAQAEAEAIEEAMAIERRGREQLAAETFRLLDTTLAASQDRFDTETAAGRRAAKQVFAARKALALAEVAIATIVSVQQALASTFPPFNAIPAAAMAVAGAANLAAVAAQKPPSFQVGGLIPSDHRLVAAQPGEAVLSTAAVRALGEEAIGGMNRGTSGGGSIEVAMVYRHRVFDRFVTDNLRRSDSPLASAIQGSRRKRKRRR